MLVSVTMKLHMFILVFECFGMEHEGHPSKMAVVVVVVVYFIYYFWKLFEIQIILNYSRETY